MPENPRNKKTNQNDTASGCSTAMDKDCFNAVATGKPTPEYDANAKSGDPNDAVEKYAKDWKLELFALFGFCVSGVIFIVSGVQNGDTLTILGSAVWIAACVVWMIPFRKYF